MIPASFRVDKEVLSSVGELPRSARVTLIIETSAGEFLDSLDPTSRGPESVSTSWCEDHLGYTSRKWRAWCEEGVIAGAKKDQGGHWRLPIESARQHLDRFTSADGPKDGPASARGAAPGPSVPPPSRRRFHGPRKTNTKAGGKR